MTPHASAAARSRWRRVRGRCQGCRQPKFLPSSRLKPLTHADAAPSGDAARADGAGHDAAVPRPADQARAAHPQESIHTAHSILTAAVPRPAERAPRPRKSKPTAALAQRIPWRRPRPRTAARRTLPPAAARRSTCGRRRRRPAARRRPRITILRADRRRHPYRH